MSRVEIRLVSGSSRTTRALGREIGARIMPGGVVALFGDLGSGKTVLVQGLARGLGVPGDYYVTSPTYTLIHEYPGRCPLYHIDLYRLEGAVDFEDIGLDEALYGDGVAAVEWAERLSGAVFGEYLEIHFHTLEETRREIRLSARGAGMIHLVHELEHFVKEKQWG